jgi:hypothetical protein
VQKGLSIQVVQGQKELRQKQLNSATPNTRAFYDASLALRLGAFLE